LAAVFYILGWCLIGLGAVFLLPFGVEWAGEERDWQVFLLSGFVSGFTGASLAIANKRERLALTARQAFLLIVIGLFILSAFAALPFMFTATSYGVSLTGAFFEAVSGLTTTGATIYSALEGAPDGLLLWRSLLQWVGGLGFVVLAMALFPYLHIGAMEIFQTEEGETPDQILSKVFRVARAAGLVYAALTVLCFAAYVAGGMSPFDALNHAFTTLSTGGFSTRDGSFGAFDSVFLEWAAVVFMIAAGTPFLLYFAYFRKTLNQGPLLSQAKLFWKFLGGIVLILCFYRYFTTDLSFGESLRGVAFSMTSVMTTTGYSTADYTLWGGVFVTAIYILMAIGGCAGSPSGGMKIFRLQILTKLSLVELKRLSHPHGAFGVTLGGRKVESPHFKAIGKFMILYGVVFAFVTLGLAFSGLDFMSSLSGAASALSNVGPGLGDTIGPSSHYGVLTDPAKWLLSFAMIAGRLEIFALLVLMTPVFWKEFA